DTDWLRAALAWPQLLVVVWVAVCLLRTRQPGAAAWCFAALGLFSYAVARTSWTLADIFIYPHGVPFPSLPDLFFILQYPCFFLALFLVPAYGGWLPGLRVLVDGLLWMSAITALSWYFVLLPISRQMGESQLSKSISMFYQFGDLLLFYGLVMALWRVRRTTSEAVGISLLSLAVASLFVGDTWAAALLLHPPYTYRTGSAPDLFWFMCYLLIPLAALVRLRLIPSELPSRPRGGVARLSRREMLDGITFVVPSIVGVGAGLVIIVHSMRTLQSTADLISPAAVGLALVLLATLRPAVIYLEKEQMRRERDAARAEERAMRLANERMETFLSMAAHELRTPLTSLIGNVQLMTRRLDTVLRLVRNGEEYTEAAGGLRTLIDRCDRSLERMARLVEDVLDETRVRHGRFALRLEACDLVSVVGEAVAEQMALNPERSIHWVTEACPVAVLADASRIEQVVTNYVSNALKFSRADRAVEVCVQTQERAARVLVHDDGVVIPVADQPHIWERYYQAAGAHVQSGSQVGFGIGLYISKAIIEGHCGQVGVESAPGQGTTMWFMLPLAASSLEDEADTPAPGRVPSDQKRAPD
ncbi:MAG: ATP-binding protein, partial [Ktedonobacterales bacterium]